ncbi:DUF1285 domain-containing protein [Xanthobacter variabilis]|uniref:DUF1285 domain-containing protein n=1 Tax=Xanthobacter variabilis TaxID=3119932 RepID=UPI0037264F5B
MAGGQGTQTLAQTQAPAGAAAGRGGRLEALLAAARAAGGSGPAPVDKWNPPDCGDMDMRIAADGTWFYMGTPIGRPALVRLFASVLTREGARYVLKTPVEKIGIKVDDAPFLAVEMAEEEGASGRILVFRTNLDDLVRCGPGHALRFASGAAPGEFVPYVHVRNGLEARLTRAVYFDLVAAGEVRAVEGREMFGIASGGAFFPIMPAADLERLTA